MSDVRENKCIKGESKRRASLASRLENLENKMKDLRDLTGVKSAFFSYDESGHVVSSFATGGPFKTLEYNADNNFSIVFRGEKGTEEQKIGTRKEDQV